MAIGLVIRGALAARLGNEVGDGDVKSGGDFLECVVLRAQPVPRLDHRDRRRTGETGQLVLAEALLEPQPLDVGSEGLRLHDDMYNER